MKLHDVAPVPSVLDDGKAVFLWNGAEHRRDEEWTFLACFRCEQCGRSVTVVRFEGDVYDQRALSRLRVCPGGCVP
jgi:hypothetical protein